MTELIFKEGDKVLLVGNENPFNGDHGIFHRYAKDKTNAGKMYVKASSTGKVHWFYKHEVEIIEENKNG